MMLQQNDWMQFPSLKLIMLKCLRLSKIALIWNGVRRTNLFRCIYHFVLNVAYPTTNALTFLQMLEVKTVTG